MLKMKAMLEMQLFKSSDVNFGDLIWVQLNCNSWWLAQAVDENSIGGRIKPRNKSAGEVLVRLYGSYKYLYVNPIRSHKKLEEKLEEYGGNYIDMLKEALQQEINCLRSGTSKRKEEFASKVSQDSIPKQNMTNKHQEASNLYYKTKNKSRSKVQNHKEVKKRSLPGGSGTCTPPNKRSSTQMGMQKTPKLSKLESETNLADNCNVLLSIRRIKVMQMLGLAAPSGSPFHLSQTECV